MEKLNKTITIGLAEDGQCGISVSPDVDCATAFQLTGTLALHLLNAFYAVANASIDQDNTLSAKDKDAAKLGIKESMFDSMNSVFSTVLAQFYPDAPKLSIEDEAILELTNQKIEDRYNKMSAKERKAFHNEYNKMKLRMQFDRATATSKSDKQND